MFWGKNHFTTLNAGLGSFFNYELWNCLNRNLELTKPFTLPLDPNRGSLDDVDSVLLAWRPIWQRSQNHKSFWLTWMLNHPTHHLSKPPTSQQIKKGLWDPHVSASLASSSSPSLSSSSSSVFSHAAPLLLHTACAAPLQATARPSLIEVVAGHRPPSLSLFLSIFPSIQS